MTLGTGTIQGHSDPHTFTGGHTKWAPHGVGGVQMSGFYSAQSLQRPQLLCFRKSKFSLLAGGEQSCGRAGESPCCAMWRTLRVS